MWEEEEEGGGWRGVRDNEGFSLSQGDKLSLEIHLALLKTWSSRSGRSSKSLR